MVYSVLLNFLPPWGGISELSLKVAVTPGKLWSTHLPSRCSGSFTFSAQHGQLSPSMGLQASGASTTYLGKTQTSAHSSQRKMGEKTWQIYKTTLTVVPAGLEPPQCWKSRSMQILWHRDLPTQITERE